jgi:hypothetical protein
MAASGAGERKREPDGPRDGGEMALSGVSARSNTAQVHLGHRLRGRFPVATSPWNHTGAPVDADAGAASHILVAAARSSRGPRTSSAARVSSSYVAEAVGAVVPAALRDRDDRQVRPRRELLRHEPRGDRRGDRVAVHGLGRFPWVTGDGLRDPDGSRQGRGGSRTSVLATPDNAAVGHLGAKTVLASLIHGTRPERGSGE